MRLKESNRRPTRAAFTLIEILVVMSVLSSVMGGAIALTIVMQQSLKQSDENLVARQQLVRFADDFRNDFHRAQRHRFQSGTLTLEFGDEQPEVVYQIDSSSISRIVESDETKTKRQDSYVFGASFAIEPMSTEKAGTFGFRVTDSQNRQSGQRRSVQRPEFEIIAVRRLNQ